MASPASQRLVDHRHVGARHAVEEGAVVRQRQGRCAASIAPWVGMVDQRLDSIDSGAFSPAGPRTYLCRSVTSTHLAAPDAGQQPVAHRGRLAAQQRQQRAAVGALAQADAEHVGEGGEDVDRGGQRVADAGRHAGAADHQRDVADRLVDRAARLAPDVLLAEVVAVVGADHHHGVVRQALGVDRVQQLAEPVVDHRQLGAVLAADLPAPGARRGRRAPCAPTA